MYQKTYGILQTLAPLHVNTNAEEETGNLKLICRDQFTQTGIIPGSFLRESFRAEMRSRRWEWQEENIKEEDLPVDYDENYWYGSQSVIDQAEENTTEALIIFGYASLVWLPVFCPGQPVVWVTCPWLLERYQQVTGHKELRIPSAYTAAREMLQEREVLFFNLGFLTLEEGQNLSPWIPRGINIPSSRLVVVGDDDMAMIHDMGLYRQSRIMKRDEKKKVAIGDDALCSIEALPEKSILVFPIVLQEKEHYWQPFGHKTEKEMYFGSFNSLGFGHCAVSLGDVS